MINGEGNLGECWYIFSWDFFVYHYWNIGWFYHNEDGDDNSDNDEDSNYDDYSNYNRNNWYHSWL